MDPVADMAVNVTDVPSAKDAMQVEPQSIPVGLEVMVPVPLPALVTVRGNVRGETIRIKVAVTD
jgi:hypothetical protein